MVALSDDSGLEIKSLGNKPGIHSARWAKKYGGFKNAMRKIISLIEIKNRRKKIKNLKANFVCSLTLKFPKKMPSNNTLRIMRVGEIIKIIKKIKKLYC